MSEGMYFLASERANGRYSFVQVELDVEGFTSRKKGVPPLPGLSPSTIGLNKLEALYFNQHLIQAKNSIIAFRQSIEHAISVPFTTDLSGQRTVYVVAKHQHESYFSFVKPLIIGERIGPYTPVHELDQLHLLPKNIRPKAPKLQYSLTNCAMTEEMARKVRVYLHDSYRDTELIERVDSQDHDKILFSVTADEVSDLQQEIMELAELEELLSDDSRLTRSRQR